MAGSHTTTRYFENTERMCRDLLAKLPADPGPHSLAVLTASSQSQHARLVRQLQQKVSFPIVGGTTLVSPFSKRDVEAGANLTMLGKPGARFAAALSDPLRDGDEKRQMAQLFERCAQRLDAAPKLLLVIMPVVRNLSANRYLKHIFKMAGNTPVFGGMVSDDLDSDRHAVFGNGGSHSDRMVLIGGAGEVDPVWAVGCEATPLSGQSAVVTASYNNVVYGVDDTTFCDFLRSQGFHDSVKSLSDFTPNLIVSGGDAETGGGYELAHLTATDPVLGCGIVGSDIPPGRRLSLGRLTRENILSSTEKCLNELTRKMKAREETGYVFSTAFCVSGIGRYFAVMRDADNAEGDLIHVSLSEGLSLMGYYGFNQIAPVSGENGTLHNRAHSDSIAAFAW